MSGNGADIGQVIAMLGDVLSVQREQGRKLDDLVHQVGSLRQAVTEYHASVLGHGILSANWRRG